MTMANQCIICGKAEGYNYELNIGMCNLCISKELDRLEAENEKLKDENKELKKALVKQSEAYEGE